MSHHQECNHPICRQPATYATKESRYCRDHYVLSMRRSMNRDQRIFLKAKFTKELKDGPHANGSIVAKISKVDDVYFLGLSHEGTKDGKKSMTLQNISGADLKRLSDFFREIADNIDDQL